MARRDDAVDHAELREARRFHRPRRARVRAGASVRAPGRRIEEGVGTGGSAMTDVQTGLDPAFGALATFEAIGDETRVTVTHTGWTDIPRESAARHGFPDAATQLRAAEWWRRSLSRLAAGGPPIGPG